MSRLAHANPDRVVGIRNDELRDRIVSQAPLWRDSDTASGPTLWRTRVRKISTVERLRWGIAVGAILAGALAVALTVVSLSGSAPSVAQAFPALDGPSTLTPAALQQSLKYYGTTADGINIAKGRTVETPWGAGYVLTGPNDEFVCVVAPGLNSADWGASCAQTAVATSSGTDSAEYAYDAGTDTARFVALLPQGATATMQTPGGAPHQLNLPAGLLAVDITSPTQIAVTINGQTTTHQVSPQEATPAPGSTSGSSGSSTVAAAAATDPGPTGAAPSPRPGEPENRPRSRDLISGRNSALSARRRAAR